MGIKIITDSTSYIQKDVRKKYDITIASLNIIFPNESIREEDITNKEFYKRIEKEDYIPTSSQPSTQELFDAFADKIKQGHKVIGIFITSKMSGTFQTAHLVKNMVLEEFPHAEIELLESNSNSMELGFAVIEAAKAAASGKTFKEVIEYTRNIIERAKFVFSPASLKYLQKGGRIGKAGALVGNVLKIIPILTVDKGEVIVANKVRTTKKAISTIIDIFLKDIEQYGLGEAIVHHINCEEEAKILADKLKNLTGKDIQIGPIGPVIGVHVGPGALGIAYFTKQKLR
ncbi:DegV family protein [Clostridium grantii]|uniref:EDD domain protein, DegV family n=1 Tax=Clostridium grantii DSM 8605 TaxID=1121316 RepID=A0A1M5UHQ2_9CLOT|nr:DegV family protein [Clostridium grantii]SHH62438.1 EDD domain protein, DegV family [Clostridium grantii DSM 8605]